VKTKVFLRKDEMTCEADREKSIREERLRQAMARIDFGRVRKEESLSSGSKVAAEKRAIQLLIKPQPKPQPKPKTPAAGKWRPKEVIEEERRRRCELERSRRRKMNKRLMGECPPGMYIRKGRGGKLIFSSLPERKPAVQPKAGEIETVGQVIRRMRMERGIKVAEFGRMIGVSKPYISLIETGAASCKMKTGVLEKAEMVLGLPSGRLVNLNLWSHCPAEVRALVPPQAMAEFLRLSPRAIAQLSPSGSSFTPTPASSSLRSTSSSGACGTEAA
jgi:hypothetical protein